MNKEETLKDLSDFLINEFDNIDNNEEKGLLLELISEIKLELKNLSCARGRKTIMNPFTIV